MKAKKLGFFMGIGIAIMFASCEDLMDLGVELDTNSTKVNFTVEPTDVIGEAVFAENEVPSDLDSVLAANDMTLNDLNSVQLKNVTLNIMNENTEISFDLFKQMEATIEVEGLPELVIATVDSIPVGAKSVTCKVKTGELMEYLKADKYIIRAKGENVAPIQETLYLEGVLKFGVHTSVTNAFN